MIPELDVNTGYLPPGTHHATFDEIREIFGSTERRQRLLDGLARAVDQFWTAGIDRIFIDGSFCTDKPSPNDIDGFWIYKAGLNFARIDPVLLAMDRFVIDPETGQLVRAMKLAYGIEFFMHPQARATREGLTYPEFFSKSRDGIERGYVEIAKDVVE